MTDRINGFTVTLKGDVREDDFIAGIQKAVLMIKGVASITPHIQTAEDWYAVQQTKLTIREKFYKFIDEVL